MSELPLITIITPSYNQGEFIEQTIDSVLGQGYPCLQYIVVDGGSTDQTLDVLRQYDRHLMWISEKDRGQCDAINKGLRMAAGEVIAFINSDDYYEPGALPAIGRFFTGNPQAAWVTGKCRTVDRDGQEIRRAITLYKNAWLRLRSYRVLQVLNYISQPATFWRRSVLEAVGLMNEDLCYVMDYDYWLRTGKQFRLSFLDRYLACFRMYPSSKSGSTAHLQFDEELRIARTHSTSALLMALHRLHCGGATGVYRRLLARSACGG